MTRVVKPWQNPPAIRDDDPRLVKIRAEMVRRRWQFLVPTLLWSFGVSFRIPMPTWLFILGFIVALVTSFRYFNMRRIYLQYRSIGVV